jgi:hypothetical protein
MLPAYQQKGIKFLKPTKLDSPKNKFWLFFYDFSSVNNGCKRKKKNSQILLVYQEKYENRSYAR